MKTTVSIWSFNVSLMISLIKCELITITSVIHNIESTTSPLLEGFPAITWCYSVLDQIVFIILLSSLAFEQKFYTNFPQHGKRRLFLEYQLSLIFEDIFWARMTDLSVWRCSSPSLRLENICVEVCCCCCCCSCRQETGWIAARLWTAEAINSSGCLSHRQHPPQEPCDSTAASGKTSQQRSRRRLRTGRGKKNHLFWK